jgi:hypothetical protein
MAGEDWGQLQNYANMLWGANPNYKPLTEEAYYQQLTTPLNTMEGPVWNAEASPFVKSGYDFMNSIEYIPFADVLATKGTDQPAGNAWYGEPTKSLYSQFNDMFTKKAAETVGSPYTGMGLVHSATGDNAALSGGGITNQMVKTPQDMARLLLDQVSMDSFGSAVNTSNRIGFGGSNEGVQSNPEYAKFISDIGQYLPGLKISDWSYNDYGAPYDARVDIMNADRQSKSGGFMDSLFDQVTRFIPGLSEGRNIAEGTMNKDWSGLDTLINTTKNVVAPYIQSSGDYVSREIGKAVPPSSESFMRPLALALGTYVFPGAGTAAANSIVNSVYGDYQRSPTKASIGSGIAGLTAYLMSGLGDLAGGMSPEELQGAITNAQDIVEAGKIAGEVPTKITPEMYDSMFGGIDRGTALGDLQGAYADVMSDIGGATKLNPAEMDYVNDTMKWPGYNVPEGGAIDMTKMPEDVLQQAEAERDTALQGLNPYEGNQGGGGSTGDPQLDAELAMDQAEFDQSEGELQDLEKLEGEMKDKNLFDDIDWKKLGEGGMKLLNSMLGGGEQQGGIPGGYFSTWGPNPRRGGGGISGDMPDMGGSRLNTLKRSRDEAGEAGSEWRDLLGILNPDLKEYVRMAALREG